MTHGRLQVVKVGGSLLDLADLPDRLTNWINAQPTVQRLLVVGGGPLVDVLRKLDRRRPIEDRLAHDLAIELMVVNASLLASSLGALPLIASRQELDPPRRVSLPAVADPRSLLAEYEARPDALHQLPTTWDTTSDAISGLIAVHLGAERLFLLKSILPPSPCSDPPHSQLENWSQAGLIDPVLPTLGNHLPPTEIVNLRQST